MFNGVLLRSKDVPSDGDGEEDIGAPDEVQVEGPDVFKDVPGGGDGASGGARWNQGRAW